MPNWKKLVVSGSNASLNNLIVRNAVTASAFVGDGSALTGITAEIISSSTVVDSFTDATSKTVTHNLGTRNVITQIYDNDYNVIVPSNIQAATDNTVVVTFQQARTGKVIVAKGGHIVSGSASVNLSAYFASGSSAIFNDITASGNVDVTGNIDTSGLLTVTGTGTSQFSSHLQAHCLGIGTAPSTTTGEIRAAGDITAFYSSDERLKGNITPIQGSLEKLKEIKGVEFDWISKEGIHSNEGHDVGVIAQDIEKVLPELVTTRDNGYKAVKYEKLVALLIESNKELLNRIEELEKKVQ